MRFIWGLVLLLVLNAGTKCYAQTDSLKKPAFAAPVKIYHTVIDSAALKQQQITDSLAMVLLKTPDPARHSALVDSVIKVYAFNPYSLKFKQIKKINLKQGTQRATRNQWVILVVVGLIVYMAILSRLMSKEIYSVVMSFYSKRTLAKVSTQESLFNSWAFIFLFILFGLTIGLFIYMATDWYGRTYAIGGFQLFITFSALVILLFILKILTIRVLGFVFDIGRLVKDYISVLYLTYFNIAFIFLPVVICFSLLSSAYITYLLIAALVATGIIFIIQYLQSAINIISNFRFHKIYLFIYLCALEICPILILIKALNL